MTTDADIELHAWGEALRRRQIERLSELADAALEMVNAIRAAASQPGADPEALNRSLAKAGRCLRFTGQVQSKLLTDLDQAVARGVYLRGRQEPVYEETPLDLHKARVERIVGRIAEREHRDDEDEIDRLTTECAERLDDDDVYGDISNRSVRELVQLICKDLNLDERPFLHEAWAIEDQDLELTRPPPHGGGGGPEGRRGELCGGQRFGLHANARRRAGRATSPPPDTSDFLSETWPFGSGAPPQSACDSPPASG